MVDKNSGYYEVYIPVWDPEKKEAPVNLTVDIYADSDELGKINSNLEENLARYGKDIEETTELEKIFGDHLQEMLRRGLVMDAICDEFGVSSEDELEERLGDEFEIFPL